MAAFLSRQVNTTAAFHIEITLHEKISQGIYSNRYA